MQHTNDVELYQQSTREGKLIAPFTPEHGIYDTEGVRLDVKLKGLDIKRIQALISQIEGVIGIGVSAVTVANESDFINDVQNIINCNEKNIGFVIPLILIKNNDGSGISYVFQDFIPSGETVCYTEANVRKDGVNEKKQTLFHLDFELEQYSIQYWYKGDGNSKIIYVEYGLSDKIENIPTA